MTNKELSQIMAVLKEAYSNFQVTPYKTEIWYASLSDLSFEETKLATLKLIATHTFPPSIAEIRQAVLEVRKSLIPNEVEALEEVVKAVKNWGVYNEAAAKDSMSPLTRRIVDAMGWLNICLSEDPEMWRNEFMRLYRRLLEREEAENQLPEGLRQEIQALADKKELKKGGRNENNEQI